MAHSIIAATTLLLTKALRRTCPKCGKQQTTRLDERRRTVRCTACGAPIPPPKK